MTGLVAWILLVGYVVIPLVADAIDREPTPYEPDEYEESMRRRGWGR